jgi:hypothetical protein
MEYEWRSGPKPKQTGFWVLLWSKDPRQLWWELRDEFERQAQEGRPTGAKSRRPKSEARRRQPNQKARCRSEAGVAGMSGKAATLGP